MKVIIGEAASAELGDAAAWYDDQFPGLGSRFAHELNATVKRILVFPDAHTELDQGIRRALIKTFPYGIIYSVNEDTIEIIAIAHLHRKPQYWKHRPKRTK